MDIDERIEKAIRQSPELKKLFEEHPEKKEMYKQKVLDAEGETGGALGINPKYCYKCMFANGNPPFEDGPEKAYCKIYSRNDSNGKPKEVYFYGAECEFYEKE